MWKGVLCAGGLLAGVFAYLKPKEQVDQGVEDDVPVQISVPESVPILAVAPRPTRLAGYARNLTQRMFLLPLFIGPGQHIPTVSFPTAPRLIRAIKMTTVASACAVG